MKDRTIAKNHLANFTPRIMTLTSFTLANGFKGEPVAPDRISGCLDFAVKCGARFRFNDGTGHGSIRLHSNHWYEFTAGPQGRASRAKKHLSTSTSEVRAQAASDVRSLLQKTS